jgi:hypothetical protein
VECWFPVSRLLHRHDHADDFSAEPVQKPSGGDRSGAGRNRIVDQRHAPTFDQGQKIWIEPQELACVRARDRANRLRQRVVVPELTGTAQSNSSEPQGQELLYSARVVLDRTQMDIDGKPVDLTPGMAVTAEVKTCSRRIVEYILSPLLRYKQESLRER